MAHFIGFVQGRRGEASRLGTKISGITASACGWDLGARLHLMHSDKRGADVGNVSFDFGSNGITTDATLEFVREGDRLVYHPSRSLVVRAHIPTLAEHIASAPDFQRDLFLALVERGVK